LLPQSIVPEQPSEMTPHWAPTAWHVFSRQPTAHDDCWGKKGTQPVAHESQTPTPGAETVPAGQGSQAPRGSVRPASPESSGFFEALACCRGARP